MPLTELLAIVRAGKIAAIRKACKDLVASAEDLDALFVAAASTGKAPILSHIETLGTPSKQAVDQAALALVRLGKDKLLAEYIDRVQDINTSDAAGRSMLSHAVVGKQKITDLLLARGADVNLADKDGRTPLGWAFSQKKAKAAKSLLEHEVTVQGEAGRALIAHAPSAPLRESLIQRYLASRVSVMTREQWIAKWGPIEVLASPVGGCEDPLGNPILKGRFTTAGYFARDCGVDPLTDALDWDAVDAAKTVAHALIDALAGSSYVPGSEGGHPYAPFFIAALGRMPKTIDLDAAVTPEAIAQASGAYASYIKSESRGDKLFTGDYFDPNEDFTDEATRAPFMAANEVARAHLTGCKMYDIYSDFVSFPTLFGGLDKDFNFIGVISEKVWT